MASSENKSEVARLRQQIDDEYAAMELMQSGMSVTSKHQFIDARMHNVDRHCQNLEKLVGKEAAMEIVIEVNNKYAPSQRSSVQQGGTNGAT